MIGERPTTTPLRGRHQRSNQLPLRISQQLRSRHTPSVPATSPNLWETRPRTYRLPCGRIASLSAALPGLGLSPLVRRAAPALRQDDLHCSFTPRPGEDGGGDGCHSTRWHVRSGRLAADVRRRTTTRRDTVAGDVEQVRESIQDDFQVASVSVRKRGDEDAPSVKVEFGEAAATGKASFESHVRAVALLSLSARSPPMISTP